MPPTPDQQNPAPSPTFTFSPKTPSSLIKTIRIFLLVLIVIGLGLIATEKLWVPELVNTILENQTISISSTNSTATQVASSTPSASSNNFEWVSLSEVPTMDKGNLQFTQKNNGVLFNGQTFGNNISPDPSTFVVAVASATTSAPTYAKDKTNIYWSNMIIPTADESSFVVLAEDNVDGECDFFAKDKNYVYHSSDIVQGADPATFEFIFNPDGSCTYYEKDAKSVYYGGFAKLDSVDPSAFIVFDTPGLAFGKDSKSAYFDGVAIAGADVETFAPIKDSKGESSLYSKDKNHIYFSDPENAQTSIVAGANLNTFIATSDQTGQDGNNSYVWGQNSQ